MSDGYSAIVRAVRDRYRKAFELPVAGHVVLKNVDFLRILLGLLYLHKYVDILGYASIASDPIAVQWQCASAIVLALCITVGLLTPAALLLFMWFFAVDVPFARSLGEQILAMNLLGLLLFGAGRQFGVDAWLIRRGSFSKLYRCLYLFAVEPTPANVGMIRLLLLTLFWSTSISAIVYHYNDALWWQGGVLQIAVATHYWNDHTDLFVWFRDAAPLVFHFLCVVGLYVQVLFELAMVPMMFLGRLGRAFVFVQGLAFFVVSAAFLNLGYLPYGEILLWGLLFSYCVPGCVRRYTLYYDERCGLCRGAIRRIKRFDLFDVLNPRPLSEADDQVRAALQGEAAFVVQDNNRCYVGYDAYLFMSGHVHPYWVLYPLFLLGKISRIGPAIYGWIAIRRTRLFGVCQPFTYHEPNNPGVRTWVKPHWVLVLALVVCAVFHVQNFSAITGAYWAKDRMWRDSIVTVPRRLFGQWAVNVFNKTDLELGRYALVVSEVDASGKAIRVVPFQDRNGGRLDYLRNDYLYFYKSLRWQRARIEDFPPSYDELDVRTAELIASVIKLDLALTGVETGRRYEARVLTRELMDGEYFYRWGEFSQQAIYSIAITPETLAQLGPFVWPSYALPPGQFASDRRARDTLAWIRQSEVSTD